MTAAALNLSALESVALLRLVSAGPSGRTRAALRRDLYGLVSQQLSAADWRLQFDQIIDGQIALGSIVEEKRGWVKAAANAEQVVMRFLGAKLPVGLDWPRLRDEVLVAKALAMAGSAIAAKLPERLASADGLRAAVLEASLGLDLRKAASAAAIRNVLAYRSIENAFGSALLQKLSRKPNLPGLIGRLIAAQLLAKPRHFESDAALVSQVAAERIGASGNDLAALRLAAIRSLVLDRAAMAVTASGQNAPSSSVPGIGPAGLGAAANANPSPSGSGASFGASSGASGQTKDGGRPAQNGHDLSPPPQLADFAREVIRLAAAQASGWAGNRKAFISDVWAAVAVERAEWGLNETGFKSLLLQAHKAGHLTLVNADLRDGQNLDRIRASALPFQNTEWHLIRVEDH